MTKEIEDEWDFPPIPLMYLGPEFYGLSPEQIAARLEVNDKYGRRVAEWRRQRVTMVEMRIRWLRRYEEMPMRERHNLLSPKGRRRYIVRISYVYLMLCPSILPTIEPAEPSDSDGRRVYKIGHTHDLNKRADCHRNCLDSLIERHTDYITIIPRRRILERLLLDHYKRFRCRRDLGEELFGLPRDEADGFEAVAKAIEQHLLAVEYLRLDATLARLKAECQ